MAKKKVLMCTDIFRGCAAEVHADSEDEVMRHAAEHARDTHGLTTIDDETAEKVRAAIREE